MLEDPRASCEVLLGTEGHSGLREVRTRTRRRRSRPGRISIAAGVLPARSAKQSAVFGHSRSQIYPWLAAMQLVLVLTGRGGERRR